MPIDALLQELAAMPHTARVQHMISLGRRVGTEPEITALIADLAQGNFFARYMAIYSCYTSFHVDQIMQALGDASQIIRGVATRLVPVVLPHERFGEALERVHPRARTTLLWKLAKGGYTASIDTYIDTHVGDDTNFLLKVLSFGSADLVQRYRERFAQDADIAAWTRMARRHPAIVLDFLEAQRQQNGAARRILEALIPFLLAAFPERTLLLIQSVYPTISLSYRATHALAPHFPRAVAELIISHHAYSSFPLTPSIQHLSNAQIVVLYRRNALPYGVRWLAYLPMSRRIELFARLRSTFTRRNDLSIEALVVLSGAERLAEAQRHLTDVHQSITSRLPYASFLPWEDLLSYTEDALHSSETDIRRTALQSIIRAVRWHPERLGDLLVLLQARRSEQDPVRQTVIDELSALPAPRWQPEHLPLLTEVIRHGLNDVGLSTQTQAAIEGLLLKLMEYHPTWAGEYLANVLRARGFVTPKQDLAAFPAATRAEVVALMYPFLVASIEQENDAALLLLVRYLANGQAMSEPVINLITAYVEQARTPETVDALLLLIRNSRFQRFREFVPHLIAADPSWIARPLVAQSVLRYHQDLLTPFLGYTPLAGRFGTGRRPWLFPLTTSASGWSDIQQERYAQTLDEIIADEAQEHTLRMLAIRRLPLLPSISTARLQTLAQSADTLVRTTALFALGRTDTLDGFATILEALQDARGRIAILIAPRYLNAMPLADALAVLRQVPTERVGVAKERVRLLATLPGEASFQELLALARTNLQRDVRAVLLGILWRHPERAEVWPIFAEAISSPDSVVAAEALPPYRMLKDAMLLQRAIAASSETIHHAILQVLRAGLEHPTVEVQELAVGCCRYLALPDSEGLLVQRLLDRVRIAPSSEGKLALDALFKLCTDRDTAAIVALMQAKMSNRPALQTLVDRMASSDDTPEAIQRLWPVVRGMLDVLLTYPVFIGKSITLALPFVPASEVVGFFTNLARREGLHAEALVQVCQQIAREMNRFTTEELSAMHRSLMGSDDARLRRISLAILLMITKQAHAWTRDHVSAWQQYREDPAPFIAEIAQFTWLPQLDDPSGDATEEDFTDDDE